MTTFKLTKLASSLAIASLLAGYNSTATAAATCPEALDPSADYKCFFFDVGTSHGGDANSTTSAFYEMGYNSTLATSIYQAGLANNSKVYDTNITTIMNYYGLTGGPTNYTAVNGSTIQSLKDTPQDPGERNIDTLSGPTPRDTERFDPQNDNGNIGWGITYNYYLEGVLNPAVGPQFTGGYFDFFFNDWVTSTSEQVARVKVTGSNLTSANLDIFGLVTFDWTGGAADIYGLGTADGTNDCTSTLCQNFWNFQSTSPQDWYSLAGQAVQIALKLDTNVNPPIPTTSQLVARTGTDGDTYWIRQTTLDGSIRFNVPEPATLSLLGLGLLVIGFSSRKHQQLKA